jgi:hypothetical protein
MRDSRIINHIGGRRRWENEMAKENWTEEKHAYEKTSKVKEEKRGSMVCSTSSVVYGGDTCLEGSGSTTAVTMSAAVYREKELLSKRQLLWVNWDTQPFILLWHLLGLKSKRKSSLFPVRCFAMPHKTVKYRDRNQTTKVHYIINWIINLLKNTNKKFQVLFSRIISDFLKNVPTFRCPVPFVRATYR